MHTCKPSPRKILVLIVAKCIVNWGALYLIAKELAGINSSKVYCKCSQSVHINYKTLVLIVAKCNVNHSSSYSSIKSHIGINSSKV